LNLDLERKVEEYIARRWTMKAFKWLSYICSGIGVILMLCALIGRFISRASVFGSIMPGSGMSATSAMIGADTFLLLAILAYLYCKKE
jgi:hypothetical protein